jgi:hypothetical protein
VTELLYRIGKCADGQHPTRGGQHGRWIRCADQAG